MIEALCRSCGGPLYICLTEDPLEPVIIYCSKKDTPVWIAEPNYECEDF